MTTKQQKQKQAFKYRKGKSGFEKEVTFTQSTEPEKGTFKGSKKLDRLEKKTEWAKGRMKKANEKLPKKKEYRLYGSIQTFDFSNQRICLLFKCLDFLLGQFVALFQLLVDARKFFLVVISLLFESIH